MKTHRFPRFTLRMLVLGSALVSLIFAWIGTRHRTAIRHRNAVFAVCTMGGTVEYESGKYGGNLAALFPPQSRFSAWFPSKQEDYVVSISFAKANRRFGTELPGKKGIVEFNPEWSKEAMLALKPHLESFPRLQRLSFNCTPLPRHGLAAIEDLQSLTSLNLEATQITDADLVHLRGLTNLKHLSLRRTRIDDDGLIHLRKLTQLKTLQLGSTRIGDEGMKHASRLPALRSLWLDNTRLTDEGLAHSTRLSSLAELRIELTDVSDDGLKHLEGLKNLTRLELDGQNISREAVERLRQKLPNCVIHQSTLRGRDGQ